MKSLATLFFSLALVAGAQYASAQEYHTYRLASDGSEVSMRFFYRFHEGQGIGCTVSSDFKNAVFYSTADYGDNWTQVSELSLDDPTIAPLANGGWLSPETWIFYFHYIDMTTYQMGGKGYYTTDNGATWQDLNAFIGERFGSGPVNLHHSRPVDGGIVAIYTESGMPGQVTVRSDSTKLWRVPLDAGSTSPLQGSWDLALYNSQMNVRPDGTIVGFGTDAGGVVQVFRIPPGSNEVSYTAATSIHPGFHPRIIHHIWGEGGFTLGDINTEMTQATVAAWSADGVNWQVFVDSNSGSSPEESGYHMQDVLAADSRNMYVCLQQWSGGAEGLGEITAIKIKRTTNAGASWETLLDQGVPNQYYGISVDRDGSFFAFPMNREPSFASPGQYMWAAP